MSYRISNVQSSLTAQRFLDKNQRSTEKALRALSSGSRVINPGDDAAGFAISETLRGQISGIRQSKLNAQSAQALIQTAEGGLNEQNNILIRLRELGVQAASDTVSDNERDFLQEEFSQLVQEFDRIAKTTRFGSKELLTGTGEQFEFHVGAYKGEENIIRFELTENTTSSEIDIGSAEVSDQDAAVDSLEIIDEAMTKVSSSRAKFGSVQSRLTFAIDNLASQEENLSAARSLIADADVAEEVTKLAQSQILQEAGISVLAQANQDSQRVLRLINST